MKIADRYSGCGKGGSVTGQAPRRTSLTRSGISSLPVHSRRVMGAVEELCGDDQPYGANSARCEAEALTHELRVCHDRWIKLYPHGLSVVRSTRAHRLVIRVHDERISTGVSHFRGQDAL